MRLTNRTVARHSKVSQLLKKNETPATRKMETHLPVPLASLGAILCCKHRISQIDVEITAFIQSSTGCLFCPLLLRFRNNGFEILRHFFITIEGHLEMT